MSELNKLTYIRHINFIFSFIFWFFVYETHNYA